MQPDAADFRVRPIDADSLQEIAWVALRMRQTLQEVISPTEGEAMYSMAWLEDRVRWHLCPERVAAVFLAEGAEQAIVGHTIVRREEVEHGAALGLFSTTWVEPAFRGLGVATRLLRRGEAWMREHGLASACTWTAEDNGKLIGLYEREGYTVVERLEGMVRLARALGEQ